MKRLIICCDGTWNRPDQKNLTNVVKLSRFIAARDSDGVPQVVFYDQGVGTGNLLDRLTGGAFGHGLDQNIRDAYLFLMNNYEDGDEIFIFGYSRGAYTARSTAGLIRNCGLLKRAHADHFPEAFSLYQKRDESADTEEAVAFRTNYAREIEIKFIGVWDTVGSLGVPLRGLRWFSRNKYQFHDTALSRRVKFAYHAVAIDERRSPFKPTLWSNLPKPGQVIEQKWFAGVHADVGGGSAVSSLSDVALNWMMEKASACGLEFNSEIVTTKLRPDPLGYLHNSMTGFYRLTRGYTRSIGAIAPQTESVHEAAVARFEDPSAQYAPENLRRYLEIQSGGPAGSQERAA